MTFHYFSTKSVGITCGFTKCLVVVLFAILFRGTVYGNNFVVNSSFELVKNGDLPIRWFRIQPRNCPDHKTLSRWFDLWEIDKSNAYHGKKSLKICRPYGCNLDWWDLGAWQRIYVPPNEKIRKYMVLSAYLKANTSHLKVMLFLRYPMKRKIVEVGQEWKRCFLVVPIDKKNKKILLHSKRGIGKDRICIGPVSSGILWIDAVQFEQGTLPSEYESSPDSFVKGKVNSFETVSFSKNLERYQIVIPGLTSLSYSNRSMGADLVTEKNFFVPIAGYLGSSWLCSSYFDFFKSNNFNTLCINMYPRSKRKWGVPPIGLYKKCKRALDELSARGLFAIVWMNFGIEYAMHSGTKLNAAFEEYRIMMEAVIRNFRDHPAVLGWYIFDEPGPGKCALWNMPQSQMRKEMIKLYRTAKKLDQKHPVFINFSRFLRKGYGAESSDIALIDYYCGSENDISNYYKVARRLVRESHGKPCWMWFHMKVRDNPTIELEPKQFISSLYQAFVAGVRGFIYFSGISDSPKMWKDIGKVNAELNVLTSVIRQRPITTLLQPSYDSSLPIKFCVMIDHNKVVLISVNSCDVPASVKFNLKNLGLYNGLCKVLFEDRVVTIHENVLQDTFSPYERHVYEFDNVSIR